MTDTAHRFPFREYLRLQGAMVGTPPQDDEYDEFILKVWEIFDLRVHAEEYFQTHQYVAITARGALPLPWLEIKSALEKAGPPETVLTLIAKRHFGTIDTLVVNIRKVLSRERSKVPIGRVQQIDPHCLRWLTRQPGYSPIEKAGARQTILGVVRRENYDTVENRVLKDFLRRCLALASIYIRKNDRPEWEREATIIAVKRLKALCVGALGLPEFEKVKAVSDLPQPNYVLQQDRLYSHIWEEYLKILRDEEVAERLWDRREEIEDLYAKIHGGLTVHCSPCARYDTLVWFNELDGRKPIVEAPIWDNELLAAPVKEPARPSDDVTIVDLTFPWDGRNTLVCPANHPNARPFIQNPRRPSLEPGRNLRLEEILENKDAEHLADYFRHLYGMIGGMRWIVLVPDHWDAQWLERVIGARPSALGARNNFFLLWRSVAAALACAGTATYKDGDELVVADGYCSDQYNATLIRFRNDGSGRAVPQRASTRLHCGAAADAEVRFRLECDIGDNSPLREFSNGRKVCQIGSLRREDGITPNGARRFLEAEAHGRVPYFDELDALSIVVTNKAEEVFFTPLVKNEECWPGGQKYEGKRQSPGHLSAGSRYLRLYLAEGKTSNDGKLGEKVVEFDAAAEKDEDVFCQAEIMPGQGLATIRVSAAFLERPFLLDLQTIAPSDMTFVGIVRDLKRHFPPTMPYVEACLELWETVKEQVNLFMRYGTGLATNSFAKAQSYWGEVNPNARASSGIRRIGVDHIFDEKTMSPIDLLKRENVFGNNPDNCLPVRGKDKAFRELFKKIADESSRNSQYVLLAAWTYQEGNPDYELIRKRLFEKYNSGEALSQAEISFCSNNFADNDKRIGKMLFIALSHIAEGKQNDGELRLAYNLMQFHPTAISACKSELCEMAFAGLTNEYNSSDFYYRTHSLIPEWSWKGSGATQKAGYLLKCLLFLLHRRRFDDQCLKTPRDWKWCVYRKKDGSETEGWMPPGLLSEPLPVWEHESTVLGGVVLQYGNAGGGSAIVTHEATRLSLIEYVNGRGTLDIPVN